MPPPAAPFLTARWLNLVMANYEVAPAVLQPLVPRGTELDLFSDKCFVSVVGFRFLDTRVLGISVPFHRDFAEVNLRFYVRREAQGELRRGVVFVKEIVPLSTLAWVANALYGEKYVALPMRCEEGTEEGLCSHSYAWKHAGRWSRLSVVRHGEAYLPHEASEEAFITEHYFGYSAQRDGSTLEYRVDHARWKVWAVREHSFDCDVAALYGAPFAPFLTGTPSSCFVADGSEVIVRRGQRV